MLRAWRIFREALQQQRAVDGLVVAKIRGWRARGQFADLAFEDLRALALAWSTAYAAAYSLNWQEPDAPGIAERCADLAVLAIATGGAGVLNLNGRAPWMAPGEMVNSGGAAKE